MQPPSFGIYIDPPRSNGNGPTSTSSAPGDHKPPSSAATNARLSPRNITAKAGLPRPSRHSSYNSTPRHPGEQSDYVISTGHLAHPPMHRTRATSLDFAEAGHGGGGSPGGGNGKGGGGGKGGGDAHDGGGMFWQRVFNPLASISLGIRARLAADPDFLYKLAVECLLDAAIIMIVNWAARGKRFVSEFEFVLCQIAVSLLNDFALVYLLAPVAPLKGVWVSKSRLQQMLDRLPAHVLQLSPVGRRPYTLSQRAACFGVKCVQYGVVGFCMGVLGTSLVHGLTELRERMDPSFAPPATMQSVFGTGVGWLYFMAFSSNVRYNMVNACEELVYARYPGVASKLASVGLRLINNFVGAANWIQVAHMMRLSVPHVPYRVRLQQN